MDIPVFFDDDLFQWLQFSPPASPAKSPRGAQYPQDLENDWGFISEILAEDPRAKIPSHPDAAPANVLSQFPFNDEDIWMGRALEPGDIAFTGSPNPAGFVQPVDSFERDHLTVPALDTHETHVAFLHHNNTTQENTSYIFVDDGPIHLTRRKNPSVSSAQSLQTDNLPAFPIFVQHDMPSSSMTKSPRTRQQKRNRKIIKTISPCLACRMDKKPCSSGGICDRCMSIFSHRQKRATQFKRKGARIQARVPFWRTVCVRVNPLNAVRDHMIGFFLARALDHDHLFPFSIISNRIFAQPAEAHRDVLRQVELILTTFALQCCQNFVIEEVFSNNPAEVSLYANCIQIRLGESINPHTDKISNSPLSCEFWGNARNALFGFLWPAEYDRDWCQPPISVRKDPNDIHTYERHLADANPTVVHNLSREEFYRTTRGMRLDIDLQRILLHMIGYLALFRWISKEVDALTTNNSSSGDWKLDRLWKLSRCISHLQGVITWSRSPMSRRARTMNELRRSVPSCSCLTRSLNMGEFVLTTLECFRSFVAERMRDNCKKIKVGLEDELESAFKLDVIPQVPNLIDCAAPGRVLLFCTN